MMEVFEHYSECTFLLQLVGVEIDIFILELFNNCSISTWSFASELYDIVSHSFSVELLLLSYLRYAPDHVVVVYYPMDIYRRRFGDTGGLGWARGFLGGCFFHE